jgi:hypothetical protein
MITANGAIAKHIIPVQWDAKHPPLVPWKLYMDHDPTANEVAEWNRIPKCNWAMLTGRANGLVVLDVDPRRGGTESIRAHPVPITFTVRTPSGGSHYHFVCPPGGLATVKDFEPGLEIRADGAYVLIPPSFINGIAYEVVCDAPAVPIPDWLVRVSRQAGMLETRKRRTPYLDLLKGVDEGARHDAAVRLAGHLLAHNLPTPEVEALLLAWNRLNRPPLPASEIIRDVQSLFGTDVGQRMAKMREVLV